MFCCCLFVCLLFCETGVVFLFSRGCWPVQHLWYYAVCLFFHYSCPETHKSLSVIRVIHHIVQPLLMLSSTMAFVPLSTAYI
jgi:hypothetical protein